MKKILLFCTCLLPVALSAQVSIPYGHGRVKLSDVVANYQAMHPEHLQNKSTIKMLLPGLTMERNEKDYQFERWLWYWQQHTDADGYLVSPAKTWQKGQRLGQVPPGPSKGQILRRLRREVWAG